MSADNETALDNPYGGTLAVHRDHRRLTAEQKARINESDDEAARVVAELISRYGWAPHEAARALLVNLEDCPMVESTASTSERSDMSAGDVKLLTSYFNLCNSFGEAVQGGLEETERNEK